MTTTQRYQPHAAVPYAVIFNMITVVGFLAGIGVTYSHIAASEFPIDMVVYQEGVRAFLQGRELYSVPMQAGDVLLPFIYPPFGALVLVPLSVGSWMTYHVAGNIMIVLSSALVLLSLWFGLRAVLGHRVDQRSLLALTVVAWTVALSMEPIRLNANYGQINVLIMGLVFLDLVPRKRWLPQGSLIGIAAAIKITPLAMLLFFLLRKDFRAIFTAAVSALAATTLAALVRWDVTVEFFNSVLINMGTQSEFGVDVSYQSNSSLKGMIMRFYPSNDALMSHSLQVNLIWLALSLSTVVLGGWLMVALLRRKLLIDAVLVNAVIMLLISPVSWSHHWVWLGLVLPVVALRCVLDFEAPVFLSSVVLIWTTVILLTPPKWWFENGVDTHTLSFASKILVSDYVWLAIILLIAWAIALRKVPALPKTG